MRDHQKTPPTVIVISLYNLIICDDVTMHHVPNPILLSIRHYNILTLGLQ